MAIMKEFLGRGQTLNEPQVITSALSYPYVGTVLCWMPKDRNYITQTLNFFTSPHIKDASDSRRCFRGETVRESLKELP